MPDPLPLPSGPPPPTPPPLAALPPLPAPSSAVRAEAGAPPWRRATYAAAVLAMAIIIGAIDTTLAYEIIPACTILFSAPLVVLSLGTLVNAAVTLRRRRRGMPWSLTLLVVPSMVFVIWGAGDDPQGGGWMQLTVVLALAASATAVAGSLLHRRWRPRSSERAWVGVVAAFVLAALTFQHVVLLEQGAMGTTDAKQDIENVVVTIEGCRVAQPDQPTASCVSKTLADPAVSATIEQLHAIHAALTATPTSTGYVVQLRYLAADKQLQSFSYTATATTVTRRCQATTACPAGVW